MLKTIALIGCAAVGLAACTQADGSKAAGMVGSPMWMMTASKSAKAATYQQACASYGFVAGSPDMAYCMQQESGQARAHAAAAWDGIADDLSAMGRPHYGNYPTQVYCTNC